MPQRRATAGLPRRGITESTIDLPSAADATALATRLLDLADAAGPDNTALARRYLAQAAALLRRVCDQKGGGADGPVAARGGLTPGQMARVNDYIRANFAGTMRIGELAAVAQLSASYFCQAFRRSFGESPYAHIVRRRIERAQEMILLTEMPLAEIALACGLADQSHLTRQFRRIVGISPGVWRRQYRDGGVVR